MAESPDWKILTAPALALLVDDNPDVLFTTGRFLEAAGFDVVRAKNGEEAITWLDKGQKYVLLVTDYAMPAINGVELARQALTVLPDLKVLIITGFPDEDALSSIPSHVAVLAKPFRRAALIKRLRVLFNGEQPTGSASGLE